MVEHYSVLRLTSTLHNRSHAWYIESTFFRTDVEKSSTGDHSEIVPKQARIMELILSAMCSCRMSCRVAKHHVVCTPSNSCVAA